MFVSDKSFRRNPKLHFFNDKELPAKGNKSERLVHQFLELLSNPKAVTPHTKTYSMDKNDNFVVNEVQISYTPTTNKTKITGSYSANKIFQQIWDQQLLHVQEQFYALFLNQANDVLCWRLIGTGTTTSCLVDNKLLASIVCKTLACNVVIAHNHPSGNLKPSTADKTLTFRLQETLNLFDVTIIDHLIISGNNYFSFSDNDLIFNQIN